MAGSPGPAPKVRGECLTAVGVRVALLHVVWDMLLHVGSQGCQHRCAH